MPDDKCWADMSVEKLASLLPSTLRVCSVDLAVVMGLAPRLVPQAEDHIAAFIASTESTLATLEDKLASLSALHVRYAAVVPACKAWDFQEVMWMFASDASSSSTAEEGPEQVDKDCAVMSNLRMELISILEDLQQFSAVPDNTGPDEFQAAVKKVHATCRQCENIVREAALVIASIAAADLYLNAEKYSPDFKAAVKKGLKFMSDTLSLSPCDLGSQAQRYLESEAQAEVEVDKKVKTQKKDKNEKEETKEKPAAKRK